MRFLRSSVCVTREHAQTHEHLWVLSEGAGRDWATARRGARSALVPPIICGSVISPARENTPAPAISPVWDFAPLPTIFGVSPRRPLAGPLRPARSPEARLRLGSVLGNAWLRKVGASIVLRDCVGEGAEGRMMLAGSIVSIVAKMHGEA